MKKLLIILSVGLALSANSQQSNSSGTISSLNVTSNTVCVCSTLNINFKFVANGNPSLTDKFYVYAKVNDVYRTMVSFDYGGILAMNKQVTPTFDTIYSFACNIPCNALNGLGNGAIFLFTLKDNVNKAVNVLNCTVGIEEYELNPVTPIYYNLNGQIGEPKSGELLIKQVGNKRIKTFIYE